MEPKGWGVVRRGAAKPRAPGSPTRADIVGTEAIMGHTRAPEQPSMSSPPLRLPPEVWTNLEPRRRRVYLVGQAIVDELLESGTLSMQELVNRIPAPPSHFVGALQLLHSMDLVSMDLGESPSLTLLALPDEHVKVMGIDGRERWVFIARPLQTPEVAPEDLN